MTLYSTLIPTVTHRHHFIFNSRIFATDSIRKFYSKDALYEITGLSGVTHTKKININIKNVGFTRTYEEREHLMVIKCGHYPYGYWSEWTEDIEWCKEDCDRKIRKRRTCSSEVCDGEDMLDTDTKCICTTFEDSETQTASNSNCILQVGGTRSNEKVNELVVLKYDNEHLSAEHNVKLQSNLHLRRGFKFVQLISQVFERLRRDSIVLRQNSRQICFEVFDKKFFNQISDL